MSKVKSYYGGSTSHYYTYNGSTLVQEKIVTSGSQTTEYLTFLYNSEGPTGFVYNNTLYTYRKNIFGDIIAVYNGTSKVAEYAYDAYGNCRVITGSNIGTLNPFRYRGYYFDEDMKLYYLQSRYYDPETGRFINADDVSYLDPETIHGLNLYAYCLNNPINYLDDCGFKPKRPNFMPRQPKRKGALNRGPTGARERNVKHPNGEEHSRVPKGNRGIRHSSFIQHSLYEFYTLSENNLYANFTPSNTRTNPLIIQEEDSLLNTSQQIFNNGISNSSEDVIWTAVGIAILLIIALCLVPTTGGQSLLLIFGV